MNAYCRTCHARTDPRRTQFGSWFRFYCMVCGTELTDTAAHLEDMRRPHPNQTRIDAEAAATLNRGRTQ